MFTKKRTPKVIINLFTGLDVDNNNRENDILQYFFVNSTN